MPPGESVPTLPSGPLPPAPDSLATGSSAAYRNGVLTVRQIDPVPAPTPLAESAAPAELLPPPTLRQRIAWYVGAIAATAIILFAGLRLDAVDFHSPFEYDADVLLILPMVKATLERGSHWRNERLGYPGIQELHDFPVIDHLHFAIIWVIGRIVPGPVEAFNAYFLLTWPFTTLTAMWAFRQLQLTLPAAAVGGILYAFLPYHYLRGEAHYFLAAYWVVPLSWLPALAICRGSYPFFQRDPIGEYQLATFRRATGWQVLLGAATASAGAYYAFFACALYSVSGAYAWVVYRTWRAAASAAGLVAVVAGFGVANHLPTFAYVAANGRNAVAERQADEADTYALKIAQLILPVDGHNVTALSQLKSGYNSIDRPCTNENACATLGAVGAAGLLGLVGLLLLPARRGWPYGPLSVLAGFILLFASMGGFGSIFNLLLFDQIRCLNRLSIYLAFICLLAVLWPLDRFLATRNGWARRLRYPAFAAIALVGIADQTPTPWFTSQIVAITKLEAERFQADRRFFARIEETMPAGSKVLNLPYIQYPEVPPLHDMKAYEHVRGYLHTNSLVWSYGAMKFREADEWLQQATAERKGDEVLRRAAFRGFDGIFVDKRGFPVTDRNHGDKLIDQINREAERSRPGGLPTITHEDGKQVFLDLRPYRDWLIRQDPQYFEAETMREREVATISWLYGFYTSEPYGHRDRFRWGYRKATAAIVNPSDRTRTFRLSATIGVDSLAGPFRIRIDGRGLVQLNRDGGPGPWVDDFAVEKKEGDWDRSPPVYGLQKTYLIEVPPGRHAISFRCTTPPKFMPGDTRPLCFYLKDTTFVEVK